MRLIKNKKDAKHRILVVSYAFPPIAVQMTAITMKGALAFKMAGYQVDAIHLDDLNNSLPKSDDFHSLVSEIFTKVISISNNSTTTIAVELIRKYIGAQDVMEHLNGLMFRSMRRINFEDYDAIVSYAPFHSINMVVDKIKKINPNVRWIAQFSDPWADNPLEENMACRFKSSLIEPGVIKAADKLILNSPHLKHTLEIKYHMISGNKFTLIPHPFVSSWYPRRPKKTNKKLTLRFLGTLFGRRTPEPFFKGMQKLLLNTDGLENLIHIEIIGTIPNEMLETTAAKFLLERCMKILPPVGYMKSLEYMYDADLLLLIEAATQNNLFVPSKLSDYIGTNNPILGIASPGWTRDVINKYGGYTANPLNPDEITGELKLVIDDILRKKRTWSGANEVRDLFSENTISNNYKLILNELQA